MSTNLMTAANEWASRPADQRFWTIEDAARYSRDIRDNSAEANVTPAHLKITAEDGEILVNGQYSKARLTHYAFDQIARLAKAPAGYLRSLPAEIVAPALQSSIKDNRDKDVRFLLSTSGTIPTIRAATSERYARIWNCDVLDRLADLGDQGWITPPGRPHNSEAITRPATQADVLRAAGHASLQIKVGDPIAPAGIYASNHDMFVFLINEERQIKDGSKDGLFRGFFVSNSEVGAGALKVTFFLFRGVCGNHIVWGAEGVSEIRVVHIGNARFRFDSGFYGTLRNYSDTSAIDTENRIKHASTFYLGKDTAEVIDGLFAAKIATRQELTGAWQYAVEQSDTTGTDPLTAWGFAQGVTRMSQQTPYTDERMKLDRAAGKIIQMAF